MNHPFQSTRGYPKQSKPHVVCAAFALLPNPRCATTDAATPFQVPKTASTYMAKVGPGQVRTDSNLSRTKWARNEEFYESYNKEDFGDVDHEKEFFARDLC